MMEVTPNQMVVCCFYQRWTLSMGLYETSDIVFGLIPRPLPNDISPAAALLADKSEHHQLALIRIYMTHRKGKAND